MALSREIVTIQVGNIANFVGSHWWNIQESSFCYSPDTSAPLDINHDVLFREGLNLRGESTYTPRLVLVDLVENLRSIRQESALYREPLNARNQTLWDGEVDVVTEKPICTNKFLERTEDSLPDSIEEGTPCISEKTEDGDVAAKSDDDCDFNSPSTQWSDFLTTYLHPKSFCLIKDLSSRSEKCNPFDMYSYGEDIYTHETKENTEDALRRMTEECDHLQGFQLIFDAHNGFSGFGGQILTHLDDEYHRRPSLCFPIYEGDERVPLDDINLQMHRLYAILMSIDSMDSHSSLFAPLSLSDDIVKESPPFRKFPLIQYDIGSHYQTSAIYAAAVETLTSIYRLKSMKFNLYDVTSAMSTYGRKMVCSSLCLPFAITPDSTVSAMAETDNAEFYFTSLTPFFSVNSERTLFQSSILRGVPSNKFQNLSKSNYYPLSMDEVFGQYLDKYSPSSITTTTVFDEKISLAKPYPNMFNLSSTVVPFGKSPARSFQDDKLQIPTSASFSNSDSTALFLEDLLSRAEKMSFKQHIKCTESSYEKDTFMETVESLRRLQDNYQDY